MALYIAKSGLVALRDGQRVRVTAGNIVEQGHWLLDVAPGSFRPLEVNFPAEQPAARKPQKSAAGE